MAPDCKLEDRLFEAPRHHVDQAEAGLSACHLGGFGWEEEDEVVVKLDREILHGGERLNKHKRSLRRP